jgi:DNA repair protein RadC
MIQVGNIVNVEVLDHLIITELYYYSFKDDGLMEELRKSTKWVPTYIEIERNKKEALKLGEKKGRKEGRRCQAKYLSLRYLQICYPYRTLACWY